MILEDYEALKCRYPSKKCWNQRAVKRNGERHNLCEMHRQKANNNQRRLDKKRKAGHMMKGSETTSVETNAPEYDYHAPLPHAHTHHPYHIPARQHAHLHPQLAHQQHLHALAHQQHQYHQQQEKRLRVSLTNMYAAAQALSPHSHHHAPQLHSPPTHAREFSLLRPSTMPSLVAPPPRQVLQLPPLTAHIPSLVKSSPQRSSPLARPLSPAPLPVPSVVSSSTSPSSSSSVKPTILLPPITSVPRCHQSPFQLPLAAGAASSASWSLRSEEKVNLA